MDSLAMLQRMWAHLTWADEQLWPALAIERPGDADAWRDYSHIIGAEETWLSRLEGRPSRLPVWPQVSRDELRAARELVVAGYARYLDALTTESLDAELHYTNTAGRAFTTKRVDILLHVALHGQYHRGKINLLLRQVGAEPVPTDYIAFVRGAPAATTPRVLK
jgi:uncharacterized damage-inducible protein DinB